MRDLVLTLGEQVAGVGVLIGCGEHSVSAVLAFVPRGADAELAAPAGQNIHSGHSLASKPERPTR